MSFRPILFFVVLLSSELSLGVTFLSGEPLNLPSGWQSTNSYLVGRKIQVLQYRNTSLQGKINTDFLVKDSKTSLANFFKSRCEEAKSFFSDGSVEINVRDGECELAILRKDEKNRELLWMRLSGHSKNSVAVIDSLSITQSSSEQSLSVPVEELKKAFFRTKRGEGR